MSSTDRYIDLGPFFPRKPVATPPARDDDTEQSPAGLADGDMSTGSSEGANNSKMKTTPPPISRNEDGSANRQV